MFFKKPIKNTPFFLLTFISFLDFEIKIKFLLFLGHKTRNNCSFVLKKLTMRSNGNASLAILADLS